MLKPLKYIPFTTNELKPTGWLKKQLRIQADGLSGNLDKVWNDVKNSKWIGGDCEGWERMPYWLDGFIPLAFLLDDEDMKKRAKKYVDAILDRQQEDGWICPCDKDERSSYDMWVYYLIAKVLVLYYNCTKDDRIEDAVYKSMKIFDRHLDCNTIFQWATARWFECLIPIFWLYERRPEEWMITLAKKLDAFGLDYEKNLSIERFRKPYEKGVWTYETHVVNAAMALKSRALMSRITGEDPDKYANEEYDMLTECHGMPSGHFSGDECLAGTSPIRGSECCSVADAMFSFENLISISGNPRWSDLLEADAFNAFPATNSADMWTHQYDQMTNQIECSAFENDDIRPFGTNGCEAHLFGLEPNFGCCTANFNQAYPKFAMSTMMKTQGGGIAVTAIAPSILTADINGNRITAEIVTDYPFNDSYKLIINADNDLDMTVMLRVPSSAKEAYINDRTTTDTGYIPFAVKGTHCEINVELKFEAEIVERPSKMFCVKRGPLLYSIPIKGRYEKREYTRNNVERKYPYCDYFIYPESKWNYAFADKNFEFKANGIGDYPFSHETPAVTLKGKFYEIDWKYNHGMCSEYPESNKPISDCIEEIEMIPYGCTDLRITEMPIAEK